MKRSPLKRKTPLKSSGEAPLRAKSSLQFAGKRARRLQSEDKQQEKATHALTCVCGCGQQADDRAHLESRRYEASRNEDWNNTPICRIAHRWLDQTPAGVKCKRELKGLAKAAGRRLTAQEAAPIMFRYGYWIWRTWSYR